MVNAVGSAVLIFAGWTFNIVSGWIFDIGRAKLSCALGWCDGETARTCASGMGWGVNVKIVSKCIETASNGPGTPILRSVRLRNKTN